MINFIEKFKKVLFCNGGIIMNATKHNVHYKRKKNVVSFPLRKTYWTIP